MKGLLVLLWAAKLTGAAKVYTEIKRDNSKVYTEINRDISKGQLVRSGRGLWDNLPSNKHSPSYQRHSDPEHTTKHTFWGNIGPEDDMHVYSDDDVHVYSGDDLHVYSGDDVHVYSERPSVSTTEHYNRASTTELYHDRAAYSADKREEFKKNRIFHTNIFGQFDALKNILNCLG